MKLDLAADVTKALRSAKGISNDTDIISSPFVGSRHLRRYRSGNRGLRSRRLPCIDSARLHWRAARHVDGWRAGLARDFRPRGWRSVFSYCLVDHRVGPVCGADRSVQAALNHLMIEYENGENQIADRRRGTSHIFSQSCSAICPIAPRPGIANVQGTQAVGLRYIFLSGGMIMLSVIVMSATAILLAGFILWSQRREDTMRLLTPRKEALTMRVQIICGNCAGVDPLPNKTYLTRSGECEQCGGRSFVLASTIAVRAARLRSVRERPARRAIKIAV